jgi:hypothetical protein
MRFTIDTHILVMGLFRLLENGTFRELDPGHREIRPGDRVLDSLLAAYRFITALGPFIEIRGEKIPTASPDIGRSLTDKVADLAASVHRSYPPKLPSKAQLASVIRFRSDEEHSILLLDLEGDFRVVGTDGFSMSKPEHAVRNEAFCAGNDLVGPDAANDESHINELYNDMLAGWLDHLETGELDCFVDVHADDAVGTLIGHIRRITYEATS